jgi:hypothetical protein
VDRLSREQFFAAARELDAGRLREVLWRVYWRGPAAVRARVEAELAGGPVPSAGPAEVDPADVLAQVREFVGLVRAGSYFAGDRRVSPKQRSRWRFVFRDMVHSARRALTADAAATSVDGEPTGQPVAPGARPGEAAVELLIDLACDMSGTDYFRSQDPIAACGVVVSDEVGLLWRCLLERDGLDQLARVAMPQLLRWESPYGWTRRGYGPVAQRETTLAHVLSGLLVVPTSWDVVAEHYVAALDALAAPRAAGHREPRRAFGYTGRARAEALAGWNALLAEHLAGGMSEPLLRRVVTHPALAR